MKYSKQYTLEYKKDLNELNKSIKEAKINNLKKLPEVSRDYSFGQNSWIQTIKVVYQLAATIHNTIKEINDEKKQQLKDETKKLNVFDDISFINDVEKIIDDEMAIQNQTIDIIQIENDIYLKFA